MTELGLGTPRKMLGAAVLSAGLIAGVACGGRTMPPQAAPGPKEPQPGTGAVLTLPDSSLAGRHVESIVELLEGRVAGLQVIRLPNGTISLRIRGGDQSLVGGSREPLLVIDDMPVTNVTAALESLRPHEIDKIQVLKDVASTAVYGTRGAHGVILITTKRD